MYPKLNRLPFRGTKRRNNTNNEKNDSSASFESRPHIFTGEIKTPPLTATSTTFFLPPSPLPPQSPFPPPPPRTPLPPRTPTTTTTASTSKPNPRENDTKTTAVARNGRLSALWFVTRFHIPALSVSAFLFAIHYTTLVWPPPGPSQETLGALQFAAKVHEALIVLSLGTVLLHRIRYHFLHGRGKGVPLGFLTSPWQLSSPLYFISGEFWGSAIRSVANGWEHMGTLLLLVSCALLAVAIGPFSAIVILPQVQLWDLPRSVPGMKEFLEARTTRRWADIPFGQDLLDVHVEPYRYAATEATGLNPKVIGPELNVTWDCPATLKEAVPSSFGCLNYFNQGWDTGILEGLSVSLRARQEWVSSGIYKNYISVDEPCIPMNISRFQVWQCSNNFARSVTRENQTVNSVGTASMTDSIPDVLLNHEGAMRYLYTNESGWDNKDNIVKYTLSDPAGNPVPLKQPLVSSQCFQGVYFRKDFEADPLVISNNSYEYGERGREFSEGTTLPFARGIYPPINITIDAFLADLVWDPSRPANGSIFRFFDMQRYFPAQYKASLGAITVYPYFNATTRLLNPDYRRVELCYSVARWIPTDIWCRSPYELPQFSISFNGPVETLINSTSSLSHSEIIRFDPSWVQSLDYKPILVYPQTDWISRPVSALEFLASYCREDSNCLAMVISIILGITTKSTNCAVTPCVPDGGWWKAENYTWARRRSYEQADRDGEFLRVNMEHKIWASGYGFQSGDYLTLLAFVVLLLHAVLAVGHVVLVLVGGWSSEAWSALGELVVLALQSSSPRLLRTNSAGVKNISTWQLAASVREKRFEDGLEMVVEPQGGGGHARWDGESEDMRAADLPFPKPNKRYT